MARITPEMRSLTLLFIKICMMLLSRVAMGTIIIIAMGNNYIMIARDYGVGTNWLKLTRSMSILLLSRVRVILYVEEYKTYRPTEIIITRVCLKQKRIMNNYEHWRTILLGLYRA